VHLPQLNILCRSLVKPYYTKMTTRPLFTIYTLRPFYVFSNILDFIKAGRSIYQNVQYFIWKKNSVFNFATDIYSLHKCSETILCLKRQFTVRVSPVSCALEKNFRPVVRTAIWSVHYSGELSNQNCIVKIPRRWWSEACFVTLLCRISQMQKKGRQTNCEKGSDGVQGTQ